MTATPDNGDRETWSESRVRITAWVCDECGYWRQEKSTGVHQTFIPASLAEQKATGNRNVMHKLREAQFIEVAE